MLFTQTLGGTMKKSLSFNSIVVTLLVIVLTGCDKAPESKVSEAKKAIQKAREADAEKYALTEYDKADNSYKDANMLLVKENGKIFVFRNYSKVVKLLDQSISEAKLAQEKAEIEKQRAIELQKREQERLDAEKKKQNLLKKKSAKKKV